MSGEFIGRPDIDAFYERSGRLLKQADDLRAEIGDVVSHKLSVEDELGITDPSAEIDEDYSSWTQERIAAAHLNDVLGSDNTQTGGHDYDDPLAGRCYAPRPTEIDVDYLGLEPLGDSDGPDGLSAGDTFQDDEPYPHTLD